MEDQIQRRLKEFQEQIGDIFASSGKSSPILDYFKGVLDQPKDIHQNQRIKDFANEYYGYVVSNLSNVLSDPIAADKAVTRYFDLMNDIDVSINKYLCWCCFPLMDDKISNSNDAPSSDIEISQLAHHFVQGAMARFYTQEEQLRAIDQFFDDIPLKDAYTDIESTLLDLWGEKQNITVESKGLPDDIQALITGLQRDLQLPRVTGIKGASIFRADVKTGLKLIKK